MANGKLITFEGPDGSGKTTQVTLLADWLRGRGYRVLTGREPGGTAIGDQVREVVHSLKNTGMDPRTEFLLYASSRAQLVAEIVRPALAEGQIVLLDRFIDSTFAYQGYGRGLDLAMLKLITNFATGGFVPDLTIYLDVDAETALARRKAGAARGAEWNRMDAEALEFYERVRAGYEQLISAEPDRFARVNAVRGAQDVQGDVLAAVAWVGL